MRIGSTQSELDVIRESGGETLDGRWSPLGWSSWSGSGPGEKVRPEQGSIPSGPF